MEIHHVIKERVIKCSKHRAQKSLVYTSLSLKKSHESYQVEAENTKESETNWNQWQPDEMLQLAAFEFIVYIFEDMQTVFITNQFNKNVLSNKIKFGKQLIQKGRYLLQPWWIS